MCTLPVSSVPHNTVGVLTRCSGAGVRRGGPSSTRSAEYPRKALRAAISLAFGAAIASTLPAPAAAAVYGPDKFIPTFAIYYGGGATLTATDVPKLAKYDLLDLDRFRYNQGASNLWSAIKAVNPAVEIYLYELGPETANFHDSWSIIGVDDLARYNVSRGHPMGSLNGNNPALFLTDAAGNRIYSVAYSTPSSNQYYYLLDFGSSSYQSYWVAGVKADIVDQPWKADGVFTDNCLTFSSSGGYSATSAKYSSDAAWSAAMNAFSSGIAAGLHGYGQKLWCNKGDSRESTGLAAWKALDAAANRPDVLLEEGAFAVAWGGGATQFFPEANWKNQVDTLASVVNMKIALTCHTDLAPGGSGTDNWGKPVTFWQSFYYSLGSMLLGKNATLNNTYFTFIGPLNYSHLNWYDEYDRIDLGKPLAAYQVSSVGGVNVYWREFEKGYVAVNPTANNVASFAFPQAVQQITHDNLLSALSTVPVVNAVALPGHNAAIAYKAGGGSADTQAPSVPAGLTVSTGSATSIGLGWAASSDNVGVTGYKVYRNGTQVATLGAVTTWTDTAVTAATTYSYAVSAFDAAGNNSAKSATVSATTAALPDTTAPSVPAGLSGTAASTSAINLAWTASTDNVGVSGYKVSRNGAIVATLGAVTSWSDSGLAAGTAYSYTVAAFDAAGNNSAPSAALVVTTTASPAPLPPALDATAPSVPSGLQKSHAESTTQIHVVWNASTDNVAVAGYNVYADGKFVATTTDTSYRHYSLTPNTTYTYQVNAFDAAGNVSGLSASHAEKTLRR